MQIMNREYLEKFKRKATHLYEDADVIIVGLSGGADSVFLLYMLSELYGADSADSKGETSVQTNKKLVAVHVNHGIRGDEALRDEGFVVKLCEKMNIECKVFKTSIPEYAAENKLSCEEAGRIYRYEKFDELRKEYEEKGLKAKIAVAHHMNDQAETVLFQLLRGSALRGMGGIREEKDCITRPLLDFKREEIEAFLEMEGISYVTDSTNEDTEYTRNKIRNEVIPYLEKNIQKETVSHIAQTASVLSQVQDYVDMEALKLYEKSVKDGAADIEFLKASHKVIVREVIMLMIKDVSGKLKDITKKHVDSVYEIIYKDNGKKAELPYNVVAMNMYGKLLVFEEGKNANAAKNATKNATENAAKNAKENEAENINEILLATVENEKIFIKESEISLRLKAEICGVLKEEELHLTISKAPYEEGLEFVKNLKSEQSETSESITTIKYINPASIKGNISIRRVREGDYIFIRDGKKKLGRIFIDKKIPQYLRENIVVVSDETHVLYVPMLDIQGVDTFVSMDKKMISKALLKVALYVSKCYNKS